VLQNSRSLCALKCSFLSGTLLTSFRTPWYRQLLADKIGLFNTGLGCCSMANYSKWDKFDPDLVCKEIDVQQSIDSSKKAKKKAFTEAASANELAVAAAKVAAESLQSQVRMSRKFTWYGTRLTHSAVHTTFFHRLMLKLSS
jgi:hypothetical protein